MTEKNGGRGRPPTHSQFGRGQKRAAGRPKGAIGEKAIVQLLASERHKIEQNDQMLELNTIELLLILMRNLAMKGNLQAVKWLTDYRTRILPESDEGAFLVVPETMPPEKWIEKMMFSNQFCTNPELTEYP